MQNKKLLIIDGSSLLSTSFYGTAQAYVMAKTEEAKDLALSKLLKTSDGQYTNGVYTFMKTLLSLIKQQQPTHMAIVWDVSRNSFRKQINADYKGTRSETPSPLKEQFILTQKLLEGIIPQFISKADDSIIYEADDFAGSLAKKFEKNIPVYLYTKDKDYLQLVSEFSRVWLVTSNALEMFKTTGINPKDHNIPSGVFEYTPETLDTFEQLTPSQIIDYKALVGDSSDNIKGVKGIGPKAALPLLKEYNDIETLYATINDLTEKEQKKLNQFFKEALGISRSPINSLLSDKASAFESKQLATIKTDIPLDVSLDQLRLMINMELLAKKLLDLEMKSLAAEISSNVEVSFVPQKKEPLKDSLVESFLVCETLDYEQDKPLDNKPSDQEPLFVKEEKHSSEQGSPVENCLNGFRKKGQISLF